MPWLDPVRAAIDRAPAPVEVFFRDDDTGWAPDRLRALLDRFDQHELPVDLAVIPAALDEALAAELRTRAATQCLGLHQHGFAHRNHEPDGRKYEFGPHRAPERQRRDIEAGAARLADLLGDLVQPIFTPPWNRCTADTGRSLAELGFNVLSRESRAAPLDVPGLDEVPIRIDFVKPDPAERLAAAVAEGGPIGVMFHHAVMDAGDIARADELPALIATHPRVRAGAILDYAARTVPGMAVLGLGLAALGRPGYLNVGHAEDLGADRSVPALRSRTHAMLDAAWDAGVRHFDAARSYGCAEEFLGEWLRSRHAEGAVVSSKWGYVYTAAWRVDADPPEVKHHDVETFRRQLAETREQLGDRLALYAIHSATPDSGVLGDRRVLGELATLKADGVRIGVTVSGTSQPETIRAALALNLFDAVQATWNLHERSAEPALQAAHEQGLTVYVKEALANGRLAGANVAPQLAQAAARLQTTPDALALAAALAKPWADVVLSGAASLATLKSNLAATDAPTPDLQELTEPPEAYWARRSELPWT